MPSAFSVSSAYSISRSALSVSCMGSMAKLPNLPLWSCPRRAAYSLLSRAMRRALGPSAKPTCGVVTLNIDVPTPALAMSSSVCASDQFLTTGTAWPALSSSAT